MNTFESILKRRSIRKYKDKLVEDEKIHKLLEAAMAAPSARNVCNWKYYVITNKDKIKEIEECAPSFAYNPSLVIVVAFELSKTLTKDFNDFAVQDCSAAIENILLEAVELELGSVWCGVYPREDRITKVRSVLNESSDIVPVAVLEIGYPDEDKESRSQFDDNKVIYIK